MQFTFIKNIIEQIRSLAVVDIRWLNTLIQAIGIELLFVLLVPVIGLLVNEIIVGGVRGAVARAIGSKTELVLGSYLLAPGVVIHESSHALFALVTGAKVTEVAFFNPDGRSLGHVCYYTRGPALFAALQNSLSACAPVVTGLLLSLLIVGKVFPLLTEVWQWCVVIYVLVSIVFHMNMSKADLSNYFRGAWVLVLITLPFCFAYLMLH